MIHWHHIIPVHAGGTDDPSNLKPMTIAEHAEAHRLLWLEHGRKGDRLGWLALSGQIGKEEIQRERSILGGLAQRGHKQSPETTEKIRKKLTGKKRSQQSIENIRSSQLGNQNCLGRVLSGETKEKLRRFRLGTTQTKETKEKISQRMMGNTYGVGNKNRQGKRHTQATKDGLSARKSFQLWEVIGPVGNTHRIYNLRKFCDDHDLGHAEMYQVAKGKVHAHKGWKCRKVIS